MRAIVFWVLGSVALIHASPALGQDSLMLGVGTLPISESLQVHLGSPGRGVLVDQVIASSPGARAGIESGDVLATVAGRSIRSPQELADVVRLHAGQTVLVELVRNHKQVSLSIPLGSSLGTGGVQLPTYPTLPHVQPGVVPDGFPPEIKAHIDEMQRRMQRQFNQPLTPGGTMQIERYGIQCETDANGIRCEDLNGNPVDPTQGLPLMPPMQTPPSPGAGAKADEPDALTDRLRTLRDALLDEEEQDAQETETSEGSLGGPPA